MLSRDFELLDVLRDTLRHLPERFFPADAPGSPREREPRLGGRRLPQPRRPRRGAASSEDACAAAPRAARRFVPRARAPYLRRPDGDARLSRTRRTASDASAGRTPSPDAMSSPLGRRSDGPRLVRSVASCHHLRAEKDVSTAAAKSEMPTEFAGGRRNYRTHTSAEPPPIAAPPAARSRSRAARCRATGRGASGRRHAPR